MTAAGAVGGRRGRRLGLWLRVLLTAGLFAVLVARLGAGAFVTGVRLVGPGAVVIALGLGLVTTVAAAGRWVAVARCLGLPLRLTTAVRACYRSTLLNSILPGGVLGDIGRAVGHGRDSGDVPRGVRAVVLERAAGQGVLLVVGVPALLAGPGRISGAPLAVAAAAMLAAVAFGISRITRTGATAVILWSAVAITGHLAMFVVATRVAGVSAPVTTVVPLVVPALVVMALPLSIGGWGPREGYTAVAFGAAGLGSAAGVTTAVVYGVLSLVAALPGILALRTRGPAGAPGTTRPARPAPPGPCPRPPVTDDRPRPTCCREPVRARGGGADRRVPSPRPGSPV
ncbi:hypothetical protein FHX45_000586 [Amycolatopsis granulosa]|nr:hypothetical protein [Amycolatopsis granulosa]